MSITSQFQSTLPVWEGTVALNVGKRFTRYFNPPSPCGEGLRSGPKGRGQVRFNPPSPCGEGRTITTKVISFPSFNPPSPCGEGRRTPDGGPWIIRRFNPPSPCGEGPFLSAQNPIHHHVSIHPPRVGRDCKIFATTWSLPLFQSTLPVWGGTVVSYFNGLIVKVSIHPPRVGRDIGNYTQSG